MFLAAGAHQVLSRPAPAEDGKPRILCIGAHPDDAESGAAGTAALWVAKGYHVKFVSVTNGDIGHWKESGPELARRRKAEDRARREAHRLRLRDLDNHDGELMPTLENRRTITREIREWKADVVITHRPNDYHPDHRYTGVLVQDSAYMVTVPKFLPEVPALKGNPVFLYFSDRFQKPYPFQPDIAVGIDAVMDKKLEVLLGMVSQFYEGGVSGSPGAPFDRSRISEGPLGRSPGAVHEPAARRDGALPEESRGMVREGPRGAIRFAEAFEIGEYGRRPDKAEIKRLFPFY